MLGLASRLPTRSFVCRLHAASSTVSPAEFRAPGENRRLDQRLAVCGHQQALKLFPRESSEIERASDSLFSE
jgi:hypothetical protein